MSVVRIRRRRELLGQWGFDFLFPGACAARLSAAAAARLRFGIALRDGGGVLAAAMVVRLDPVSQFAECGSSAFKAWRRPRSAFLERRSTLGPRLSIHIFQACRANRRTWPLSRGTMCARIGQAGTPIQHAIIHLAQSLEVIGPGEAIDGELSGAATHGGGAVAIVEQGQDGVGEIGHVVRTDQ